MNKKTNSGSYYLAYIIKKLWALVALSLVVVAVTLSLLRYSLPYMDKQKHHLEEWLSAKVGVELKIGEISAKWQGLGPAFVLRNVQLVKSPQSPVNLSIAETSIQVDFWQSVYALQIQANKFDLRQMELELNLASFAQDGSEYPIVEALEALFLQQLQLFSISQSKIILNTDNAQPQVVLIDQVSWVNEGDHHQGVGQLQIQEIAKNSASFVLDLYGQQNELHGTFFAKGEEVDLSPWVQQWVSSEHTLVESRGSFVMWASIENKSLQSLQLDLSKSRFGWQGPDNNYPEHNVQLEVLGGQINANPVNDEWLFNLNNLTVQINDSVLVTNWRGKITQAGSLTLQHKQPIQLAQVSPMLALAMGPDDTAFMHALQPQATLSNLALHQAFSGDFSLKGSITDLQWQQVDSIPGMAGLATEVNWFNGNGRFNLKGKAGELAIDNLLPSNIAYQRFAADLYVQALDQGFTLALHNTQFKSELLSLYPQAFYRSADNHFALSTNIAQLDIQQLPELYPTTLMGAGTRDYLVDALQSGQVKGAQILWHGAFDNFPYEKQQGVFQAQVQIADGKLKFAPQWPALTDLSIDLLFENQSLSMFSQQGNLLDVKLNALRASIPKLAKNAVLVIDADAQATGQQVTELMLQSSIADSLGKTLQQVQVKGPLTTSLNLTIPLSGEDLTATGEVFLAKNQVTLPNLDMQLNQASGMLRFVNNKIDAPNLKAKLLAQDITLAFTGEQQAEAYQSNINIQGDWQVTPLLTPVAPGLVKYLSGHNKWTAEVALTLPEQGYQYSANIFSELTQVDSKLPAPFAKSPKQKLPLRVSSQGNQHASSIKITLGDQVEFNGNLPHQDMQFSRAHLAIGKSDLVGMGLGFSISADVTELDVAPWYDVVNALISDLPNSDNALLEAPKRIFINADTAIIASQRFTDLEMVAKNTEDSWLFDIDAKQTRMEVALHKDWLNKGVDINADFIDLTEWTNTATKDQQQSPLNLDFSADLASLPPVTFSCNRCGFMQNDLGKIDLKLSRSATGMTIDSLRLNNAHGLFYGSGDWFLANGQSSTRLTGEFSSSDFGAFLKGFNLNSGIKDSKASSTFDISWQRAPYEFNFESLNGQIDWRLSDGYLTEVSDKGSRIFSLLSLDSLVRKLQLDFRDIFAKGFFYDKIKGSFQLENGIAYTSDTSVDGGAGEITMQGYTDLPAQQLNYQIEFVPNVTSSLPVIIAWMVNPATALAAVALDQMLTSAKVISNIKFSLTGTLEDPQLKELGRDSKEVTLPAKIDSGSELIQPQNDLGTPISE